MIEMSMCDFVKSFFYHCKLIQNQMQNNRNEKCIFRKLINVDKQEILNMSNKLILNVKYKNNFEIYLFYLNNL